MITSNYFIKKVFSFLLLFVFHIQYCSTQAFASKNCKAISPYKFDEYVIKYTKLMNDTNSNYSTDDYLIMVKLSNTISWNHLKKEIYLAYIDLFYKKELRRVVDVLKCSTYKGMCYYSKRHNIFIGCKPDENSMFKIEGDIDGSE